MKKLLVLMLVIFMVSPAFADRKRLRGPSSHRNTTRRSYTKHYHSRTHGIQRINSYPRSSHLRHRRPSNRRHITRQYYTGHHNSRSYIYRRNQRLYRCTPGLVYQIIYIMPRLEVVPRKSTTRRSKRLAPIHKTIIIGQRKNTYPYVSRNHILSQCKQKIRSNVYKNTERKQ